METEFIKISQQDLTSYIGKRVNTRQLEDILDTYIILTDVELKKDSHNKYYTEGTLDKISSNSIDFYKENSARVFHSLTISDYASLEYSEP